MMADNHNATYLTHSLTISLTHSLSLSLSLPLSLSLSHSLSLSLSSTAKIESLQTEVERLRRSALKSSNPEDSSSRGSVMSESEM